MANSPAPDDDLGMQRIMGNSRSHAEVLKLARSLDASTASRRVRLGVLASFTADLMRPYLVVEGNDLGLPLDPWFGPFGQFEQLVLDEGSPLWRSEPDVLWIAMRLEDVDRYLTEEFPALAPELAAARVGAIRERLTALAASARHRFAGPILVSGLTIADQEYADPFDASNPDGLVHLLAEQNRALARDLSELPDAHLFDYGECVTALGRRAWRDARLWYVARAPVAREALPLLSRQLARAAAATLRAPAKVLVVDLDNTLWGGVLGDDGAAGIQLSDDHPGCVYKDLQAALLGYRRRGFLLAIASKNDEQLVRETLDSHPEMLLRSEHFAAIEANWDPKPESLVRIAERLNVGLESLVFIDDNPVERAQVRAELPMVRVPELPADPLGFLPALRQLAELDRPRILAEDRGRAAMVAQDVSRRALQGSQQSLEDFLGDLDMVAEVGSLDEGTQDRIHQLVHKTNQFNLTTRRHGLAALKRMASGPDGEVWWLRLRDRFGDLGLICVGILRRVEKTLWEIDSFLMSCRVMGRGVEDAFLAHLAARASARGAQRLRGVFIPTPRNAPVADFYTRHGFEPVASNGEDVQLYEAKLVPGSFPWPHHIQKHASGED